MINTQNEDHSTLQFTVGTPCMNSSENKSK